MVSKSEFAGVALACGNEVSQVLVKVLILSIGPIADVRIGVRRWSFINVASIRLDSWIEGE